MKLLLNTFLTGNKFMSEKHPRDFPVKFCVFLSQKQNTKYKKLGQMVITEYVYIMIWIRPTVMKTLQQK